jgi:uncharacterized membrane protein YphA (DoxX/SURF4 family)
MNLIRDYLCELTEATRNGWQRFWFAPVDPATICLIRILTGAMLLYTHAVWTLDLEGFFGTQSRISPGFVQGYHDHFMTGDNWAWSYLNGLQTNALLWGLHVVALILLTMFMVGLFTRVTSVFAFLIAISYAHRAPGALFGLDQINTLLTMYLVVAPSGARYSLDRWWNAKKHRPVARSTMANVAIRLLQIHLCIIYLFAGVGKLQGTSWWSGTAMWLAMANYEYQSLDMTWLGRWPKLINLMTHVALAWEVSYIALIWPRMTRPIMLACAVPLHLGIGACMGMMTFGIIMLVANLAFVSPGVIQAIMQPIIARLGMHSGD